MRVLFFATFFEFEGHDTYYTEEIKALVKNFPSIEVLVYSVTAKENKSNMYNNKILWIQRRSLRSIKTAVLFVKDMIKIFTRFKPDIIHSVYVIESIIMGIFGRIFRVPSILHARGMDINYYPFISLKRNIYARIASKLNNIIITVSKSMKKDCFRLNIPKDKIITIYDGIEFMKFNPENKDNYDNNRRFEILHIGRFSEEKRHDLIIETCKKLKSNNIDFNLTLIGIGPLQEKIKKLVKKYNLENNVQFAGWVYHAKIPNYLNKADLFILPSTTEGMPISALEAMSMKIPIILTNVGGMPELIQKNGGTLIEKNNIEQLYNAIMKYINNPQLIKSSGKVNREFIINNFNWNIHAENLFRIYKKIRR